MNADQSVYSPKLAGTQYVPMRLRTLEPGTRPLRTKILAAMHCEHKHTVCERCAETWEIGYDVFYDRTAGGRALKRKMEIEKHR